MKQQTPPKSIWEGGGGELFGWSDLNINLNLEDFAWLEWIA